MSKRSTILAPLHETRPGLLIALCLGGAALLALGVSISFWMTTGRFGEYRPSSPSRLYGRPLVLVAGEALAPETLREALADHGYEPHDSRTGLQPGGFAETEPGTFLISRRAQPWESESGRPSGREDRVEIRLQDERIVALREAGATVERIELDRPHLATYLGPRMRESRPVEYHELPSDLVHAVLAAEDSGFFRHGGLSLPSIARAAVVNLKAGRVRQGASTITQQLARLLYLDHERTFVRKGREAMLSVMLDLRYSKRELLEAYLNEVYLGMSGRANLVGIGAASYAYFGKSPRRLALQEAALLAGMIRSPRSYSPVDHPERARARRDEILQRMERLGWIPPARRQLAAATPIELALHPVPDRAEFGWFAAAAAEEAGRRYRVTDLERGGYSLFSTLDLADQRRAQAAVELGLSELEKSGTRERSLQAALVSLDPRDGSILAYVGGRDFELSEFDRAARARRTAGSAFKPVVIAAALDAGHTLADRVADSPVVVRLDRTEWRPHNDDNEFRGPVSVREVLEQSLNVPSVRLALETGLPRIAALGARFGLAEAQPLPALALGTIAVTPVELARLYATLAAEGRRPSVHALDEVLESSGVSRQGSRLPPPERVIDAQTTYLVTSALQGAILRGTGGGVRRAGLVDPLAAKTGTSDDGRDCWFAGYAADRATVVWVGHDDNSPTRLSGSRGALPIWSRFMLAVRPRDGYKAPSLPDGVVTATIDPETGYLASPACPERRTEVFHASAPPRVDCPLHSPAFLLAEHDGAMRPFDAQEETAPLGFGAARTGPAAGTPSTGSLREALTDIYTLDARTGSRGDESWIVIRRAPRPAAPELVPLPARRADGRTPASTPQR